MDLANPPSAAPSGAEPRHVVVYDEYLDGIMALTVRAPESWDEEIRVIDGAILDAYEDAWTALRAAETRLCAAMGKQIPNPHYEAPDDDE